MVRMRACASVFLLLAFCAPASAIDIADELTCAQAIASFEANGMIYVMANSKFAVPMRQGTPISKAATLSCPDQGAVPRPITVRTYDTRRCTIAVTC